jgi:hypothetical protein
MAGAAKPAMKRLGYFGEEGYVGVGDPYKTKVVGKNCHTQLLMVHTRSFLFLVPMDFRMRHR